MKRTAIALTQILASLLLLIVIAPSFQVANGNSQTFQLTPEAYQGVMSFELQVGDRIEGSFTLSNLGPYHSIFDDRWVTYWINVWFEDPEGETILNFTHTNGDTFNYTALDWGEFNIWAYCSSNNWLEGAKNAEMTIDFSIVKAKMPEPPIPDLMAWWKLNEGNGTIVYDSSWHNRQGTIKGANWIKIGNNSFLNFNGESDYVSLPSFSMTSLDAFTVSAWINSDFTKSGFIVYHGNNGEFQLGNGDLSIDQQVSHQSINYANFSVKLQDYKWYHVLSSSPLKPNTWHHIVGVWIKGVALKIYFDGVLAGQNNKIPPESLYEADKFFPASLGIYAQAYWDKQGFFKGQMSNVMIYNRALDNQEIQDLTAQIAQLLSIPKPLPETEQFPTVSIMIASGASIAAVAIGILLYVRKRKQGQTK